MALPFFPQPKPSARLKDAGTKQRDDDKRLAELRAKVWARDHGRCQNCERRCIRTLSLQANRGEVHHKRGRNVAPEDRYNVDACQLLCLECHQRAQRHLTGKP